MVIRGAVGRVHRLLCRGDMHAGEELTELVLGLAQDRDEARALPAVSRLCQEDFLLGQRSEGGCLEQEGMNSVKPSDSCGPHAKILEKHTQLQISDSTQ